MLPGAYLLQIFRQTMYNSLSLVCTVSLLKKIGNSFFLKIDSQEVMIIFACDIVEILVICRQILII